MRNKTNIWYKSRGSLYYTFRYQPFKSAATNRNYAKFDDRGIFTMQFSFYTDYTPDITKVKKRVKRLLNPLKAIVTAETKKSKMSESLITEVQMVSKMRQKPSENVLSELEEILIG